MWKWLRRGWNREASREQELEFAFKIGVLGSQLAQMMKRGDEEGGRKVLDRLQKLVRKVRNGDGRKIQPIPPAKGVHLLIDPLLLELARQRLCSNGTSHFVERLCYAAGYPVPNLPLTFVATQLIDIDEFDFQNESGCRPTDEANARALGQIEAAGMTLVCHLHSHPGASTAPSRTDLDFQHRLESSGYKCPGGIFSEMGNQVRWFACPRTKFKVTVIGNGVRRLGGREDHVHEFLDVPMASRRTSIRVRANRGT